MWPRQLKVPCWLGLYHSYIRFLCRAVFACSCGVNQPCNVTLWSRGGAQNQVRKHPSSRRSVTIPIPSNSPPDVWELDVRVHRSQQHSLKIAPLSIWCLTQGSGLEELNSDCAHLWQWRWRPSKSAWTLHWKPPKRRDGHTSSHRKSGWVGETKRKQR